VTFKAGHPGVETGESRALGSGRISPRAEAEQATVNFGRGGKWLISLPRSKRKRPPTEAALLSWGGWVARIEKLRNARDKLRWRERLRQHDAVRDTLGRPIIGVPSAHVNDGKVGVDFSRVSGQVPPVKLSRSQIDVCDKRSVFAFGGIKQLDGIFA
jgi:hypothetical protein